MATASMISLKDESPEVYSGPRDSCLPFRRLGSGIVSSHRRAHCYEAPVSRPLPPRSLRVETALHACMSQLPRSCIEDQNQSSTCQFVSVQAQSSCSQGRVCRNETFLSCRYHVGLSICTSTGPAICAAAHVAYACVSRHPARL